MRQMSTKHQKNSEYYKEAIASFVQLAKERLCGLSRKQTHILTNIFQLAIVSKCFCSQEKNVAFYFDVDLPDHVYMYVYTQFCE